MRLPWGSRYGDVISRQISLFEEEHASLLERIRVAQNEYNRAPAGEAEERFGDYMDLVETAEAELLELRDRYASHMAPDQRERYGREFWRRAERLLPSLSARKDYMRQMGRRIEREMEHEEDG